MELYTWSVLHLDCQIHSIYLDLSAVQVSCIPFIVANKPLGEKSDHQSCFANATSAHHSDLDYPAGARTLGARGRGAFIDSAHVLDETHSSRYW